MATKWKPANNSMGGKTTKQPFQYGSIPSQDYSYSGSGNGSAATIARPKPPAAATIQKPSYQPASLQSLAALQGKAREAADTANNPLTSPGAQQTLQAIQTQLNVKQQQGLEAAKARGARSGQAGFQGALGMTAGKLAADNSASYADASAQLALQLAQQARAQELAYNQAAADTEAKGYEIGNQRYGIDADLASKQSQIAMQRYGIDADLAAKEASLRSNEFLANKNNLIEQARLAEQARQFETSTKQNQSQFDTRTNQDQSQFDANMLQRQKEQADTTAYNTKLLDLKQSESAFQKAKETLGLAQQANTQGLLSDGGLSGAYQKAGVSTDRFGQTGSGLVNIGTSLVDPSKLRVSGGRPMLGMVRRGK